MPEETVVSSFEDLLRRVSGHGPEIIYRGVKNATNHRLIPKVGRFFKEEGWPDDQLGIEQWILRQFERRALPYLQPPFPRNKWEWIALAQHHGSATRLLDWTENPLVATFFAVGVHHVLGEPKGPNEDCAVYMVNVGDTNSLPLVDTEKDDPFELGDTSRFVPGHLSPRIVAQQGLFTCHPKPAEAFERYTEKLVIKRIGRSLGRSSRNSGSTRLRSFLVWTASRRTSNG